MARKGKQYLAIDLKSFYASVECRERGLDPMTTNLVVADASRTEKTICLAVSPSLKSYGIPGRARLFEVIQKVDAVNAQRRRQVPGHVLLHGGYDNTVTQAHPEESLNYIVAPPRMALYIQYSTRIHEVYLKYVSQEDIIVYSIDEVMMDVTNYLDTYHMTARELARTIIQDVLHTVGITATAGIGPNLYLCKVAMDIMAKHIKPDKNGVRIAQLNEMTYRRLLWNHRPLTDFWRVGKGYARKLEALGLHTMGDIARCSIGKPTDYYNEDLLYKLFGINAELLIDHAWGWEPCTIADVKAYRPENRCICSGQVLQYPYPYEKARLVVREMAEMVSLDLLEKGMATDQLELTIGYDRENIDSGRDHGETKTDMYGRKIPKHAHGTANLRRQTSSTKLITEAVLELYEKCVDPKLTIRRITIGANKLVEESTVKKKEVPQQLDLFTDYAALEKAAEEEDAALEKERRIQEAVLGIKQKFGKNAILKASSLEDGATAKERNNQIGGHKA